MDQNFKLKLDQNRSVYPLMRMSGFQMQTLPSWNPEAARPKGYLADALPHEIRLVTAGVWKVANGDILLSSDLKSRLQIICLCDKAATR